MNILVINAGSSSLKYQLLNPETGALLAKEVDRRVKDVDYPLLIASAYSGFVIWHAGLSGSIPLQIGAQGGTDILGVNYYAGTMDTIFHPVNLGMVIVILLLMPLVNYAMHPDAAHTIAVDPALLAEEEGIQLNGEEQRLVSQLSQEYFQGLTAEDVAKITDIAMTETGYPASGIKIMASN